MGENAQHASCLNCGAAFEPDSISRKQRFAQCTHCGALHSVSRFYTNDESSGDLPVALPLGMHYREGSDTTELFVRARSMAPVSVLAAGMIFLSLLLFVHAALAIYFNQGGNTVWMKSGTAAIVMFALGLSGYLRSYRITIATFWAGGLHWDFRWNLKQHVRHLELAQIKGFIAVPVRKGVQLEVISADGQHHSLVPGTCDEEFAGTVLHLAEHALRRARKIAGATSPVRAARPPATSRAAPKRRCTMQVAAYRRDRAGGKPSVARLQCEGCGAPMTPAQIDRDERSATCKYCGLVRDVSDFLNVPRPEQRKLLLPDYTLLTTTDAALELKSIPPDPVADSGWKSHCLTQVVVLVLCIVILPVGLALLWDSQWAIPTGLALTFLFMAVVALFFRKVRQDPMNYIVRLSAEGVSRSSKPVEDLANFDLKPEELHSFIPQAYDTGDGTLKYAVLAEDRDGNRFTIAVDLLYAGAALALVDRLDAAREQLHPPLT